MTTHTFADRYREAGLEPTAEKIHSREEPVKQIVEDIELHKIVELTMFYFGRSGLDMTWFRDEFVKADASFSMINNDREARVLAALVLSQLIRAHNNVAILSVCVCSVRGARLPPQSSWLVLDAEEAFLKRSVAARAPKSVDAKFTPTVNQKLTEDIDAAAQSPDLTILLSLLKEVRKEAQASSVVTTKQMSGALTECQRQLSLMREESQMLWWLTGGYSKALSRPFASLLPEQAALAGATDLAMLTTYTALGPVAIPAMLDKIVAMAKKTKAQPAATLNGIVDGFSSDDREKLNIAIDSDPFITPVSSAIIQALAAGTGAWHSRFNTTTGLDASLSMAPVLLAEQLYREQLLGQLL